MGDINSRKYVGKTVQVNYDAITAQADDQCLFCLTRAQQMALIAIIEPLGWTKRWYSPTDQAIDKDFVEDFLAQLEANLMTDFCNIGDQIQSLVDLVNDLTYQIKVIEDMTCVAQEQQLTMYRANLLAQGQAAFPDTTFSSDSSMPDQSQLYGQAQGLCQTIERFIKGVLADQLTRDSLTVGLIAGGAGLINPILGVIASGLGGALLADFAVAVNDQSALDDVACCMYAALRDAPVTFDSFSHSLDDCGFSFPDNNATVAGAVALATHDEANYVAFVSVLKGETNKALASAPTSYPQCGSCSCGDTVDMTIGQHGDWEIYMGTFEGAEGVGSVDNTDNFFGSHHTSVRLVRNFNPPCPHIDSIDIYYKQTSDAEGRGTAGANLGYFMLEALAPDDCVLDFQANTGTGITFTQDSTEHMAHYVLNEDDIQCVQFWDHLNVYKYFIRKIVINT